MPESTTSKETTTKKKDDDEQFGPINDTLGVGNPAAGYVSPDLSFHDQTGELPDDLKKWHEERNEAREKEVKEVAESEKKAAKEQREQQAETIRAAQEREQRERQRLLPSGASASDTSSSSK